MYSSSQFIKENFRRIYDEEKPFLDPFIVVSPRNIPANLGGGSPPLLRLDKNFYNVMSAHNREYNTSIMKSFENTADGFRDMMEINKMYLNSNLLTLSGLYDGAWEEKVRKDINYYKARLNRYAALQEELCWIREKGFSHYEEPPLEETVEIEFSEVLTRRLFEVTSRFLIGYKDILQYVHLFFLKRVVGKTGMLPPETDLQSCVKFLNYLEHSFIKPRLRILQESLEA